MMRNLTDVEEAVLRPANASVDFILTGKAQSIQHVRRVLNQRGVGSRRVRTKAYWAPGKRGLESPAYFTIFRLSASLWQSSYPKPRSPCRRVMSCCRRPILFRRSTFHASADGSRRFPPDYLLVCSPNTKTRERSTPSTRLS